jgi:hypothetical protein
MNPHTNLNWKKYHPPVEAAEVLTHCKRLTIANTAKELIDLACGGPQSNNFEVAYDVPGKGRIVEATVARVRNGVAANYTEAYMRRRDPDCMVIGDGLPTDKESFQQRFATEFAPLRQQTFEWLKGQELAMFGFIAGGAGTDVHLEKLAAEPPVPLLFLSIDAVPGSRAFVWEHIEDAPGKRCPNPRLIIPRKVFPGVVEGAVTVDIRSFGVRTPPCTKETPTYGIMGILHILPPSLAWLWRLVSPRGYANPSIVDTEGMTSEGVGSYWPFATGRRVDQANLLLRQFAENTRMRHILCPNQHIGAWQVGFMPQWIAREYLARRGVAKFRPDQLHPARCPLLGHTLHQLQVEGRMITRWFLQVDTQPEVGPEAYDQGAQILQAFFHKCLADFQDPDLDPLGQQIIACCLEGGKLEDYEKLIPAS